MNSLCFYLNCISHISPVVPSNISSLSVDTLSDSNSILFLTLPLVLDESTKFATIAFIFALVELFPTVEPPSFKFFMPCSEFCESFTFNAFASLFELIFFSDFERFLMTCLVSAALLIRLSKGYKDFAKLVPSLLSCVSTMAPMSNMLISLASSSLRSMKK